MPPLPLELPVQGNLQRGHTIDAPAVTQWQGLAKVVARDVLPNPPFRAGASDRLFLQQELLPEHRNAVRLVPACQYHVATKDGLTRRRP